MRDVMSVREWISSFTCRFSASAVAYSRQQANHSQALRRGSVHDVGVRVSSEYVVAYSSQVITELYGMALYV